MQKHNSNKNKTYNLRGKTIRRPSVNMRCRSTLLKYLSTFRRRPWDSMWALASNSITIVLFIFLPNGEVETKIYTGSNFPDSS